MLDELRKLAPKKPVRYVIASHTHFDHAGGLRAAAAEGATIDAPHGPAAPARGRQARTLALLVVGLAGWVWIEVRAAALHGHGLGPVRWILIGAAAALALVPGVRRGVAAAAARIRSPSQWAVERAALGVGNHVFEHRDWQPLRDARSLIHFLVFARQKR